MWPTTSLSVKPMKFSGLTDGDVKLKDFIRISYVIPFIHTTLNQNYSLEFLSCLTDSVIKQEPGLGILVFQLI